MAWSPSKHGKEAITAGCVERASTASRAALGLSCTTRVWHPCHGTETRIVSLAGLGAVSPAGARGGFAHMASEVAGRTVQRG